jgi:hypothetical protein
MIAIRHEIATIEAGQMDRANNPLKNAPHTRISKTNRCFGRPTQGGPEVRRRKGSKGYPTV